MALIKPSPNEGKLTYVPRVKMPNGRKRRFPGHRDKEVARRWDRRIQELVLAKTRGEQPSPELQQWAANVPKRLVEELIHEELLPPRLVEPHRSIFKLIEEYIAVVAARANVTSEYVRLLRLKLNRTCKLLGIETYAELREEDVQRLYAGMTWANRTRGDYTQSMRAFTRWCVKTGRAHTDPLADLKGPSQYLEGDRKRRPFTVAEVEKLREFLLALKKYPQQKASWTGYDRWMIYWTAIHTMFRYSELRSLRVSSLHLDQSPPTIVLSGKAAKDKRNAVLAISVELATALREYTQGRGSKEVLFPFPSQHDALIKRFRRDLESAGIPWQFEDGQIRDFHTLRSTGITWLLIEYNRPPRQVQARARLSSVALVDRYSRYYQLEDVQWLNNGPQFAGRNGPIDGVVASS